MANIKYSEDGKTLLKAEGVEGHFVIPEGVTTIQGVIEDGAFSDCAGLTSIEIPNSVTKIGDSAFSGCTGLTSVEIPNSVTEIGERAFWGCTGLTSIKLPNSVTAIGACAFYYCTGLTTIEIPSSVTAIVESVFYGCTGLTSVEIPNSVIEISSSAFYGCTGLTSVEIPDSVIEISSSAFYGCTGLTSIEIPNSVTGIGSLAFDGCTGLTSVEIPNSVIYIGDGVFEGCKNIEIEVSPASTEYMSQRGSLYLKDGKTLLRAYLDEDGCFSVPDGVETLYYGCFSGLEIAKLIIPASVKKICEWAFRSSRVQELHISCEHPERDLEINEYAFNDDWRTPCAFMKDCTLYVPSGSEEEYRHHPIFSQFKEVIIEK